jgi:hypothetical protein
MTNSLLQIKALVTKYFDGSIDLSTMQAGLNCEINNLENTDGQDIRKLILHFEACIEDVRFTVSDNLQKSEIEKCYKEVFLPMFNGICLIKD